MKKLICSALLLCSFSVFAQEEQPKHIISIGTNGFGWSGVATIFDWDKDESGIKDHDVTKGNLSLNYSYVFPNRFMIGAFIETESSDSEMKGVNGNKVENRENATEIGIGVGYNFNEDVFNSWWIQAIVAAGSSKEETKDSSGKDKFEYDYSAFYLKLGKRINLESWGLKNISYNPTITFASAKVSGDAEDAGLERMSQVSLEIIRFDILF